MKKERMPRGYFGSEAHRAEIKKRLMEWEAEKTST